MKDRSLLISLLIYICAVLVGCIPLMSPAESPTLDGKLPLDRLIEYARAQWTDGKANARFVLVLNERGDVAVFGAPGVKLQNVPGDKELPVKAVVPVPRTLLSVQEIVNSPGTPLFCQLFPPPPPSSGWASACKK